jgi:predicted ATPase
MRIRSLELKRFKRFHHLRIEIPDGVKLVILAGPNGSGKSSLFEAFRYWHEMQAGRGLQWDASFYPKAGEPDALAMGWNQQIDIQFYEEPPPDRVVRRKVFYMRSAYRNDPQFRAGALSRQGPATEERRFERMIDNDAAVALNYQRLASQALEDALANEPDTTTLGEFRDRVIGDIRRSMERVFPDLLLHDLGNPLTGGTFRFDKGTSCNFLYQNLSGGEKAAFDLLLDMVVKRREFDGTVFCVDEPEAHMNTGLQAALLEELVQVLPAKSQLWLATHSIGMMRRARVIERQSPGTAVFLDFSELDFDKPQTIAPAQTGRAFWERSLNIALDDLSNLVAPNRVVVCEGAPVGHPSKNTGHDAACYTSSLNLSSRIPRSFQRATP